MKLHSAMVDSQSSQKNVRAAVLKLTAYCKANEWAGHDPYDALNSRMFKALPFLDRRLPRLVVTQMLKRSPVDIRRLLLVPKTQNPKAIGLFLSAFLNLSKVGVAGSEALADEMVERLIDLRSVGTDYWCWGYSFPWQTRTIVVPAGTPNLVCTSFVSNALLDAYEQRRDSRCLSMAVSAAEYILNELYWTDGSVAGFSYPLPSLRAHIHNANFLAAALFCRIYKHTGEKKFLGPAMNAARYSARQQREDGSWSYGDGSTQGWVDNFHTGYNLGALRLIGQYIETTEFESAVRRGFDFYRDHFIRKDGAPRYFHDRTYPIDIHCVAQTIITLLMFEDLDPLNASSADAVIRWALNHMWDERGFFYYRVLRTGTIRTSYMRWSQAWMLLAFSIFLSQSETPASDLAMTSASAVKS